MLSSHVRDGVMVTPLQEGATRHIVDSFVVGSDVELRRAAFADSALHHSALLDIEGHGPHWRRGWWCSRCSVQGTGTRPVPGISMHKMRGNARIIPFIAQGHVTKGREKRLFHGDRVSDLTMASHQTLCLYSQSRWSPGLLINYTVHPALAWLPLIHLLACCCSIYLWMIECTLLLLLFLLLLLLFAEYSRSVF